MSRQRRFLLLTGVLFLLLCVAAGAHAAEEGSNPVEQPIGQIFKWINFAFVAGLILWVFAKKLPSFFRRNADSIASAISKAAAVKAEADRQLREAETKLARLEQEIAALRASAQRDAAAETQRIRNLTESDAQKTAAAARAEIAAAERAARIELKALAARLAVDGAESLLVRQLTPSAQESLISNFVKTLEGRPN